MAVTTDTTLDLDARYSVHGYGGIAWYALGHATTWTEETWTFIGTADDDRDDETNYVYDEPEEIENPSMARMVMVGDDRVFEIDVDDLTVIGDDEYCHECGQIGCTADGR